MFRAVRLRLIGYVVGVLALVLVAVGAFVYVLLTRQLDAAVDTELRAAAARAAIAPGPRAMAAGVEPPQAADGIFAVRLTPDFGPRSRLAPSSADDHARPLDEWRTSAGGAVPAGLPDMTAVQAARPGRDDLRTVTLDGSRYRLLTRAVGVQGRTLAVTQVGVSLVERDRQERIVLLALAGGGALGLALTVTGGLFLTGRALAPLRLAFERQRRFIGDASHELRTPLALLRLEAEQLAQRLDRASTSAADQPRAGEARPLLRQVDRIARLVDDLLTLARLDEEGLPLEREPIPAASLLDTAAEQARRLSAAGVVVSAVAPRDLWVSADPDRLHQVLLILVDNAARVTPPEGRITLTAERQGTAAVITVADTGPGIPAEHQARVFERFYRVDRARSRQAGGAGLGLAIAREIMRAHAGEITLESAPSAGTRVRVRLPAIAPPLPIADERAEEAPAVV
jgi:two-component system sensor histidine kinase CiaH